MGHLFVFLSCIYVFLAVSVYYIHRLVILECTHNLRLIEFPIGLVLDMGIDLCKTVL